MAKLYAESAREALHKIEVRRNLSSAWVGFDMVFQGWLGPQAVAIDLGPLNRPTNSR